MYKRDDRSLRREYDNEYGSNNFSGSGTIGTGESGTNVVNKSSVNPLDHHFHLVQVPVLKYV